MKPQRSASFSFRKVRAHDQRDLEEMALRLYSEDPEGEPMTREKMQKTISHFSSHPDQGEIIVLLSKEKVAGYAIIIFCWSNEHGGLLAHVDELYVKDGFRGQGLATQFFAELATGRWGQMQGIRLAVTPGNNQALQFYSRLGFDQEQNAYLFKQLS